MHKIFVSGLRLPFQHCWDCVVPENIHAHPKEGLRKFQRGGGFQKLYFLKESMTLKWNFRRGGGFKLKNLPWERYGYFQEQHIQKSCGISFFSKLSFTTYFCNSLVILTFSFPHDFMLLSNAQPMSWEMYGNSGMKDRLDVKAGLVLSLVMVTSLTHGSRKRGTHERGEAVNRSLLGKGW